MGEYATRRADGARIKIGTCAEMYYLRLDQVDQVEALRGNVDPATDTGLRFRLPFPDEDHIRPGEFEDYNRGLRMYRSTPDHRGYEMAEDYAPAWLADVEPGILQLVHREAGLLVTVPCHHGAKLPELGEHARAHWNGKGHSLELFSLKRTAEGIRPVIRCRHCGSQWSRAEWSEVLDYIPGEMRERLAAAASDYLAAPQLVEHYGLAFRVLATFPEGDTEAANAYMAAHPGAALLCIRDGVAYLAHEDDRGQPLAKAEGTA